MPRSEFYPVTSEEPDQSTGPLAIFLAENGHPPLNKENRLGCINGATIIYLPDGTGVMTIYREGHLTLEDKQELPVYLKLRGDNLPVHGELTTGLNGKPETAINIKGPSVELPQISELGGIAPQVLAGQDAARVLEYIQNPNVVVHDLMVWRASFPLSRDVYQNTPSSIGREIERKPVDIRPSGAVYNAAAGK